jgi:Flp pilus assembly protein TadG
VIHRLNLARPSNRNQRGVAAVELGLLLGVLVTLAFGVAELGRAGYQYNAIAKGARDAARYLAQQTPGTAITNGSNLAVFANLAGTGEPVAPGLAVGMVSVCDRLSCQATHDAGYGGAGVHWVTVTVTGYTFVSLASFVVPNITFSPISASFPQL